MGERPKNAEKGQFKKGDERTIECAQKSVAARAKKKTAREIVQSLLYCDYELSPQEKKLIKKLGYDEEITNLTMMIVSMYRQSLKGSRSATEMLLKMLGEQGTDTDDDTDDSFIKALEANAAEAWNDEDESTE